MNDDGLEPISTSALRAGHQTLQSGTGGHLHKTESGLWVRCYHKCRTSMLSPGFWLGITLSFPLEHMLWEKVPPFSMLSKLLGL